MSYWSSSSCTSSRSRHANHQRAEIAASPRRGATRLTKRSSGLLFSMDQRHTRPSRAGASCHARAAAHAASRRRSDATPGREPNVDCRTRRRGSIRTGRSSRQTPTSPDRRGIGKFPTICSVGWRPLRSCSPRAGSLSLACAVTFEYVGRLGRRHPGSGPDSALAWTRRNPVSGRSVVITGRIRAFVSEMDVSAARQSRSAIVIADA
jgi:hypothetical protein